MLRSLHLRAGLGLLMVATALSPMPAGAAAGCAKAHHPGGEWRTYGADLSNTRSQPREKTIGPTEAATLAPVWAFAASDGKGSGDFTGTPVIADGCMYVASNEGFIFAVNADNGKPVWTTKLASGGSINSSVTVEDGKVFASVSRVGKPYNLALDQDTGRILWETTLDKQDGSDTYATPQYFDDMIFQGVSGGSAELSSDEAERYRFQGNFSILDADTGRVLVKTWVIRPPDKNPNEPKNDYAGATVWSTPAVDPKTGFAYFGASNPFRPQAEHRYTNALLKVDFDRGSPNFGTIVDHYKGEVDEYIPEAAQAPCIDLPGNPPPWYPQGAGACADLDLDMGASPNLYRNDKGKLFVGIGQKAGIYHVVDPTTMKGIAKGIVGNPGALGGIVGSTAVGPEGVFGPNTLGGYLWSVDRYSAGQRWFAPVGDGAHWGNPVSTANGVVYTTSLTGFLHAYDAATGAPLLATPMALGAINPDPKLSWGGVSIARNTVYAAAGITGLPNGYVVAYQPQI
ncbi:MAG TPA: PQQ-binding-like beta-propeller repeat protein [Actinomycetota bacterium]|nr:PQQ-binding-like beta-propeller repeat protein [Actinomycetota bacterium]